MARSRKNESKMIVMRIEDNYPKSILVGEWRLWIYRMQTGLTEERETK